MATVGLEIKDLSVQYSSAGYVVKPIDAFNVEAHDGELILLLGPSGSGKTTLLSCLSGLLSPSGGNIRVGSTDVTSLAGAALDTYRRAGVGIVFQAFNLIPSLTARENVAAPLRLSGLKRPAAYARADELLTRVGLADRLAHRPAQLSGGQQQRVAIARALVHDPPLIVADEPTAHLDYVQVEEILALIRGLAAPGRLVIVATHDARFTPLADRVIELVPKQAKREPKVRQVELAAGELLFEQGAVADFVYVVDKGVVQLFRSTEDGGEEMLAKLGPGQYFGEMGVLLGLPRSASARAAKPARLTGYGPREFRRWSAG